MSFTWVLMIGSLQAGEKEQAQKLWTFIRIIYMTPNMVLLVMQNHLVTSDKEQFTNLVEVEKGKR